MPLVKVSDTKNMPLDRREARDKAREFVERQVSYDQGTINDVIMLHHGDNSQIAVVLSGNSDKKSPEYKAALRNIQRYRKGDIKSPGKKYQERLVNSLKRNDSYLASRSMQQTRGATVTVKGTIQISKIAETRTMKATMNANQLSRFLSEALHNNEAGYSVFANAGNYPEFVAYNDVVVTITT